MRHAQRKCEDRALRIEPEQDQFLEDQETEQES